VSLYFYRRENRLGLFVTSWVHSDCYVAFYFVNSFVTVSSNQFITSLLAESSLGGPPSQTIVCGTHLVFLPYTI